MPTDSYTENNQVCIHLGEQNYSLLCDGVCFDDESGAFLQIVLQTIGHFRIDADVSVLCHNPAHCGTHKSIFRDCKGVQVWRKKIKNKDVLKRIHVESISLRS